MTRTHTFQLLATFLILIAITGNGFAQRRDVVARIDSLMMTLADHGLFNGSLLVAEKGQIIYQRSAGYADRHHRIPHTDTTHFNLASLSKPFTAIAVLQLVQQRKIKLEDSFVTYFPVFPYPTITIRQLLTHTSGLPILERQEDDYIKAHPDELISNQTAYTHLIERKAPALFQPGDEWRYNNTNYLLLAMLVEKVSRMPFAAYLKRNLFIPAGMRATYVREATMPNTVRYTRPALYTTAYQNVDSLDHRQFYTYYQLESITGSSNIVSTIQDLWAFTRSFFGGKLLNRDLMEVAFAPAMLNSGKLFRMGSSTRSYGLGWNVYDSKTEPVNQFVFHDGRIVGLTTCLHRNLTQEQTIVFYDNTNNNPIQVMVSVSNLLNGLAPLNIQLKESLVRLYGTALVAKGSDHAVAKFNEVKDDTAHYYMDELEMNRLGFDLLQATFSGHQTLSLEVFKLNTLLYPKSGNAYDSYAIALAQMDHKEEAIAMYRKSIALSPTNEAGKRALQKLLEK